MTTGGVGARTRSTGGTRLTATRGTGESERKEKNKFMTFIANDSIQNVCNRRISYCSGTTYFEGIQMLEARFQY